MPKRKDDRQSIKVSPKVYKQFIRLAGLAQALKGESLSQEDVIAPVIRKEIERLRKGRPS